MIKEETNPKLLPALEGILFAVGKSLEISEIAQALEISEKEASEALRQLQKEYDREERGIRLIFLEDKVQLGTKPEYYSTLIRLVSQPRKRVFSEALMETLAIVAYKQPVTRAEIERIRGVKSDHAINRLIEYDLIEEAGRMDAPGKPILFATTEEFLRSFGVSSLLDLPMIDPGTAEEFRREAEKEIPVAT